MPLSELGGDLRKVETTSTSSGSPRSLAAAGNQVKSLAPALEGANGGDWSPVRG